MDCDICNHTWSEWRKWTNPCPTYGQSLHNEYKICMKCKALIFKYKPEGSLDRPYEISRELH